MVFKRQESTCYKLDTWGFLNSYTLAQQYVLLSNENVKYKHQFLAQSHLFLIFFFFLSF